MDERMKKIVCCLHSFNDNHTQLGSMLTLCFVLFCFVCFLSISTGKHLSSEDDHNLQIWQTVIFRRIDVLLTSPNSYPTKTDIASFGKLLSQEQRHTASFCTLLSLEDRPDASYENYTLANCCFQKTDILLALQNWCLQSIDILQALANCSLQKTNTLLVLANCYLKKTDMLLTLANCYI